VVLKGSGSIVACPGRTPSINPTGSASLASAGTGDVLAGWIGGLLCQRTEATSGGSTAPAAAVQAFDVAVAAVFMHGAAADRMAGTPARASDLIEALHRWRSGFER
jgi:ADP-dependent NAD(P)H-hydrate dehydratase / NAD(P)H-hydrate epimerase